MRRRLLAPLVTALVAASAGCSIHAKIDQIENEYDKIVELVCDCPNPLDNCEAQFSSPFSFADRDCFEDALAEDKKASKESLDCTLEETKKYRKCYEDNLVCDDYTSVQSCQVDSAACPQLPEAVQLALQACSNEGQ
ncbi:MAG: hypothetical protein R3B09_31360 [Nannocystaceae bacterium]